MARPTSSDKAIKFTVSMSASLYSKLVEVLRPPFSTAPEGKLEVGVMSTWVQEAAAYAIANASRDKLMEKFLEEKELLIEFEKFYRANNFVALNDYEGLL